MVKKIMVQILDIYRFVDNPDRHTFEVVFCFVCFIVMEQCAGGSLVDWIDRMKARRLRATADKPSVIVAQMVARTKLPPRAKNHTLRS